MVFVFGVPSSCFHEKKGMVSNYDCSVSTEHAAQSCRSGKLISADVGWSTEDFRSEPTTEREKRKNVYKNNRGNNMCMPSHMSGLRPAETWAAGSFFPFFLLHQNGGGLIVGRKVAGPRTVSWS